MGDSFLATLISKSDEERSGTGSLMDYLAGGALVTSR
jgi:hypothetical protein